MLSGKESSCNAGDPSSNPGSGRSPGEGIGYPLQHSWASLVAQLVKESTCNAGDLSSIPGLGRSHGGGHGNTLQCSFLENPHGHKSLVGCSTLGRKELDPSECLSTAQIDGWLGLGVPGSKLFSLKPRRSFSIEISLSVNTLAIIFEYL